MLHNSTLLQILSHVGFREKSANACNTKRNTRAPTSKRTNLGNWTFQTKEKRKNISPNDNRGVRGVSPGAVLRTQRAPLQQPRLSICVICLILFVRWGLPNLWSAPGAVDFSPNRSLDSISSMSALFRPCLHLSPSSGVVGMSALCESPCFDFLDLS